VADAYAAQLSDRYEVATAYSGHEALDALTSAVDVVLLDRRMPELAGGDVLREIRERGLDARVAMVTAIDPDFDIIDMPFDDYPVKPATGEDLIDTVERLLTCAAYESHVRTFYALSSKHAALQATKAEAELENSEEFRGSGRNSRPTGRNSTVSSRGSTRTTTRCCCATSTRRTRRRRTASDRGEVRSVPVAGAFESTNHRSALRATQ